MASNCCGHFSRILITYGTPNVVTFTFMLLPILLPCDCLRAL